MKPLVVALLVAFAVPAHAGGDMVRTLERGVRLSKSWPGESLSIRGSGWKSLSLRRNGGEYGVIAVEGLLTRHGFFLGSEGKLSNTDRMTLDATLKIQGYTRAKIVRGLRAALVAQRAETKRLAAVDGKIDDMLRSLKDSPRAIHPGLDYQPREGTGGMLVISESTGVHAIFLGGDQKSGFSMSASERATVANILLQ